MVISLPQWGSKHVFWSAGLAGSGIRPIERHPRSVNGGDDRPDDCGVRPAEMVVDPGEHRPRPVVRNYGARPGCTALDPQIAYLSRAGCRLHCAEFEVAALAFDGSRRSAARWLGAADRWRLVPESLSHVTANVGRR